MSSQKSDEIFSTSIKRESSPAVNEVINRLNKTRTFTEKPMFATLKDLMVFAATVGKLTAGKKPLSNDFETEQIARKEIYDDAKNLGFLYMIAMNDMNNLNPLKSEKSKSSEQEAVQLFEQYANAGFYQIFSWLEDKPSDQHGHLAVIDGMKKILVRNAKPLPSVSLAD